MRIYADLRSLQDPCYAFRGIGGFGAAVLRHARRFVPAVREIVGLIDRGLPALDPGYAALVDRVQSHASPHPGRPILFYQPSPMTHEPSWLAPLLGRPGVFAGAIVHDFIPLEEARYLPTLESRRRYLNNLGWLRLYHAFGVNSAWTGRRLEEVLGPDPEDVAVVGASLRTAFVEFNAERAAALPLPVRFPPWQYFVLPGGQDPRKNLELPIRAHAELLRRLHRPVGLVIAGHYEAGYRAGLEGVFAAHGGRPEALQFLPHLSDDELGALFFQALAVISPSRREGFSLPVIEGMACGSPALASSIEPHRELVRCPDALFDPEDWSQLASLMERLVRQPAWRDELVASQEGVAQHFAEERVAERFWTHLARRQEARPAAWGAPSVARVRRRPRLAVLGPYPPDNVPGARQTADVLRRLSGLAEIDVYTDSPNPREDSWVRQFAPLSPAPHVSGDYDRVLSVVGDGPAYARVLALHNRYGGPCLVHDGGLPTRYLDDVVQQADPLLVHSPALQRDLQTRPDCFTTLLPFCLNRPLGWERLTESARRQARRRLRLPEGRVVIVAFGPTNALADCLWALEQLRAWGVPADLHLLGTAPGLGSLIEELGLADHVQFREGTIVAETYRDYLCGADFALQLCTAGVGNVSEALVDCLGAGLPTVANREQAEGLAAPDYLLAVPDHLSPTLVAEQLLGAWEAGRHRFRLSPARDAFLAEHSPEQYARVLLRALEVE